MLLHLHSLPGPSSAVGSNTVEVVERKGRGHPDTLTDALAEAFSAALSRHYLERFGRILHHNVDKALLFAGSSRPAFGGGEVVEPMEIYLAGRVISEVGGERVPVEELAEETVRTWFRRHLRFVDPERHVRVHPLVRGGSAELSELADEAIPLAGDTSFGVGHAPLTRLEATVLDLERSLTSAATLAAMPFVGEDVKVMGIRVGDAVDLTVAAPLVDRYVVDRADYVAKKEQLRGWLQARAGAPVVVNAADLPERDRYYLTVTGTSAEAGDDGQVGRGNRVNGLITPGRPMTLEATAGKNPRNHAGKLYALAAQRLADGLVMDVAAVVEVEVMLVSRIGQRLDDPWLVRVQVRTDGRPVEALSAAIAARVRADLAALPALTRAIVSGEIGVA